VWWVRRATIGALDAGRENSNSPAQAEPFGTGNRTGTERGKLAFSTVESQAGWPLRLLWDHGQRQRVGRGLQPGDGTVAGLAVAWFVGGAAVVGGLQAAASASGTAEAAGRPLDSLDVAKRGPDEPYALIGQVRICGRPGG